MVLKGIRLKRPLTQLVMAALEVAIQPFRATTVWCRVWMAGSKPGHDEWWVLRSQDEL